MDYLTSGNACLKEGAFFIALGAFLTSLGWFLLAKYGDINRLLSKVKFFRKTVVHIIVVIMLLTGIFAFIIIGIIKVGKGGTLTTKGWRQLDNASQKKALIVGLAREWLVNELYQSFPSLSFDPNDPNWGVVISIYNSFKTSASNSILRSNLFDLRNKDEQELCLETMLYELNATSCNEWFTFLNWEVTRKGTTGEHRKEVYQQTIRNSLYEGFKESHGKIGMLLKKRYNWALEEAVLLLNEKTQKAIKEKYNWPSEKALNNREGK